MVDHGAKGVCILIVLALTTILVVPISSAPSEGATYLSQSIEVEGNSGFITDPNSYYFTGNGTASDPYVLKDYSINASMKFHGIYIANTTAHFIIQGCTVHDAYSPDRDPLNITSSGSGIVLYNVTNGQIIDYLGDYNIRGITVVDSSNITISSSYLSNNINAGVHLEGCLDGTCQISNCTFQVGDMEAGVVMNDCQGTKVVGNLISEGITGVVVSAERYACGGNLIANNELTGQSDRGVSLGGNFLTIGDQVVNNRIVSSGGTGIWIYFGTGELISGNEISGCTYGVQVMWTSNNITANTLSNNTHGIIIGEDADLNVVSNNSIVDGAFGITVQPSTGNQVLNNTVVRMDQASSSVGIYLGIGEVLGTLVQGNTVSQCNVGIRAASVAGQEISGLSLVANTIEGSVSHGAYLIMTIDSMLINNSISSNGGNGTYLGAGCHGLLLAGNTISYNAACGLFIRGAEESNVTGNIISDNSLEGIYLESGSENVIYGNALLFNKDSGRVYSSLRPQAYCGDANNSWSLGTGNLWADWLSPDQNEDGIVDLPYVLSGVGQDPFPLVSISGLEIPADIVPPQVIERSPEGLDVEVDSAVSVTFSEDMDKGSVIVTVNDGPVEGSWNDRTLVLNVTLDFETDYSIKVNGQDLAGNNMSEVSWSFHTEDTNATVYGVVRSDDAPLEGVTITCQGQTTHSGEDGRFSLILSPGNHTVSFIISGYEERYIDVTALPGDDLDMGIVVLSARSNGGGTSVLTFALLIIAGVAIGAVGVLWWRKRK